MITVTIGTDSRNLQDVDPQWVTQEINGRRKDGESVCVQVRIQEPGADVILRTPTCGGGPGGGRAPNSREQPILLLWERHHLTTADFVVGDVVAFLKKLSGAM